MRKGWWLLALPVIGLLASPVPPRHAPKLPIDLADLGLFGADCRARPECAAPTLGGQPAPRETATRQPARSSAQRPAPRPAGQTAPAWSPLGSGLRLLVSIPQQRLYAYRDGVLVTTSPVSTGKRGHATPLGTFRITQKQVFHRSNKYSNAPMPFMQRITNSGVALHAGHLPGYPASHGCIRLPYGFARRLYAMTTYGTPVTVTNIRPAAPRTTWRSGRRRRPAPMSRTAERDRRTP